MSKEKDLRIIPNEVIVIGKLRDEKDTVAIDLNLPVEEQIAAMMKKFKFIRDTAPNAAAQAAGFLSGKFFQCQVGDPGGEMIILPNGNKVRKSRETTDPGDVNIFASNRAWTFEELKEELLAKRISLVGGDPNNGKLRLKEFALMGFMDVFPLGFRHNVWTRDKEGKLVAFMSNVKQDNGSFKPQQAVRNTGRHFVFEDDIANLEGLRDNLRKQVERWKIVEVGDNTSTETGEKVTPPVVAPTVEKPADDSL
jgi:hypothetical protein